MVISSEFRMRQYKEDDYQEDAPTLPSKTVFQVKYFIQITPTKFELPVQRHPLHQTISKYQGSGEYFTFFDI